MTGEKTKGRKRHIVTDTMGNILAVHVHAANIHDTKGGVYTFEEFYNIRIDISMQIKEQKGFQVIPRRWVVERTFAWLNFSRRLSKDYEVSSRSAECMIVISHAFSLLKRL